jgi:hypothetical protein
LPTAALIVVHKIMSYFSVSEPERFTIRRAGEGDREIAIARLNASKSGRVSNARNRDPGYNQRGTGGNVREGAPHCDPGGILYRRLVNG